MQRVRLRQPEERRPAGHARREGRPAVWLPPVIGHRGAAGRAPENTLAALRSAKEFGCSWVEFDVRLTVDGALVLCHDANLDRTTDGGGLVAEQPLATIRRLDAGVRFDRRFVGEPMPTLDEALAVCAGLGMGANIEMKAAPGREYATAAAVVAALQRRSAGSPRVLVSSFLRPALAALRLLAPEVPRGALFRYVPPAWSAIVERLGCVALGVAHHRLHRRRAAEIRAAGYQLMAYTVNCAARARVLYSWGVTSVFTDVPDIILDAGASGAAAGAVRSRTHRPAPAQEGTLP